MHSEDAMGSVPAEPEKLSDADFLIALAFLFENPAKLAEASRERLIEVSRRIRRIDMGFVDPAQESRLSLNDIRRAMVD